MKDKILTDTEALYYLRKELDRRTTFLWRTQSGEFVNIKHITDDHLINIIKHLEKKKAEQERMNEALASYPYDI